MTRSGITPLIVFILNTERMYLGNSIDNSI